MGLLPFVGLAFSSEIQLQADSIKRSKSGLTAQGNVRLRLETHHIEAAELIIEKKTIFIVNGRYSDSKQTYSFAFAQYKSPTPIQFSNTHPSLNPIRKSKPSTQLFTDGVFTMTDVRWSQCKCDTPPWSLEAKNLTLSNEAIDYKNPTLVLYNCIKAPIPRFIIEHADMLPQFSIHADHYRVGFPIQFKNEVFEHHFIPEYRHHKSYGASIKTRSINRNHTFNAIAHHEFINERVRGGMWWNSTLNHSNIRFFSDSNWFTDDDVWTDYAIQNRFILPSERRIWVASGPLGMHYNQRGSFSPEIPLISTLNLQHSTENLWVIGRARAGTDPNPFVLGNAQALFSKRYQLLRVQTGVNIESDSTFGNIHADPSIQVDVPMWSSAFGHITLLNVGIKWEGQQYLNTVDWFGLYPNQTLISGAIQTDYNVDSENERLQFQIRSKGGLFLLDLNQVQQNLAIDLNIDEFNLTTNWFRNDSFHRLQSGIRNLEIHSRARLGIWGEIDLLTPSIDSVRWDAALELRDTCNCWAGTFWSTVEPQRGEVSYGLRIHLIDD